MSIDHYHSPVTLGPTSDAILTLLGQQLTLGDVTTQAELAAHVAVPGAHHDPVTLGAGSDASLALAGQALTLLPGSSHPPLPPVGMYGQFFGPQRTTAQAALGANTLWFTPCYARRPFNLDRLQERVVVAGGAGALIRFGLYTIVNELPGNLIPGSDTGDLPGNAIANVEGIVAASLPTANPEIWFCIAALTNDGGVEIQVSAQGFTAAWTDGTTARDIMSWTTPQAYGALPAVAPAIAGAQNRGLGLTYRRAA